MRAPLLVIALLGLALVGCSSNDSKTDPATTTSAAAPTTPASSTVNLDAKADGTRVTLKVGQEVRVSLAGNPTTGALWQLRELDQTIVKQKDDPDFRPDPNPDNKVGVGGTSIWTFTALAPGSTKLAMDYSRPWEQGVPPYQTFSVTIDVGQ
ncbi:protease inhibitor I42 family protein [Nocardia pseudobrasiliensis]|uniref:Inhibitor of cysteine peptidase n=1 Tax=Nocardia pseudobrasiliensis TaxID=45979 RepID=A0A370IEP2_9NOCA|nr:protease inhibitor I42 family protein [Nocardia pseudobrasiliensis]RDI69197.1 inhibitor of cysteine peptidase [Nocardia pseudobrasiliensis]